MYSFDDDCSSMYELWVASQHDAWFFKNNTQLINAFFLTHENYVNYIILLQQIIFDFTSITSMVTEYRLWIPIYTATELQFFIFIYSCD